VLDDVVTSSPPPPARDALVGRTWLLKQLRHVRDHVLAALIAGVLIGLVVEPFLNWCFSATVHGVIQDEETEKVVPNASIFTQDGPAMISAVTDNRGEFTLIFRHHKPQAFYAHVLHPCYESLEQRYSVDRDEVSGPIKLIAYAQNGYVKDKDSTGKPVTNAKVCYADRCTNTERNGFFRLPISSVPNGTIISLDVEKDRKHIRQTIVFSREVYQTIVFEDVMSFPRGAIIQPQATATEPSGGMPSAEYGWWTTVLALVNTADERREVGEFGQSFELYSRAWNSIPEGKGLVTASALQSEVMQANSDYGHADFKSASDRLHDLLHEVVKDGQNRKIKERYK